MTSLDLYKAIGGLDCDLIESAFPDRVWEERVNLWARWGTLAACFGMIAALGVMGFVAMANGWYGDAFIQGNIVLPVVIYDMPFVFVPVFLAAFAYLSWQMLSEKTPSFSALLTVGAVSILTINLINCLGVWLYSAWEGIRILDKLPMILIASNVGLIAPVGCFITYARKKRKWWHYVVAYLVISFTALLAASGLYRALS